MAQVIVMGTDQPHRGGSRHGHSRRQDVAALRLSDGGLLDYDDVGSGTPIVFLHGWSLGKGAFGIQRRTLSGQFRVIVPDMRGHGASARFGEGDTIGTLASDLEELLGHLELNDVILVGWSMGALVAWELARGKDRDRIAGIVSIDMVPRVLNDDDWQYGLRAGTHLYDAEIDLTRMREDWAAFSKAYVPKVFADDERYDRSDLKQRMIGLIADNDVESMANLWTQLVKSDYVDFVRQLDIPTLVTYGKLSQIYTAEAAAWMEQHLPDARKVQFDQAGHAPHLEQPEEFNSALAAFANELTSRPQTA